MKTKQQWEDSEGSLNFTEFFKPGDIIDEEAYLHMLEAVPPRDSYEAKELTLTQAGEAEYKYDGTYWYPTFSYNRPNDQYMYLGILPVFKKSKI